MTADPTSWTALKASLANWINRDDLGEVEIPEAIALAERRFDRILVTPDREAEAVLALAGETVALPADFSGVRAAWLDTDPRSVLEPLTLAELRGSYPSAATGRPRHYAILGNSMLLGPPPDAAYDLRLTYLQTIPPLGASQPTNWLLAAHPDAYLHAALHELFLITMDEQRADFHDRRLGLILEDIARAGRRRAHGQAPRIRSSVVV